MRKNSEERYSCDFAGIIVVIILIMGTDFQSVDEYYLTHVDDIKPDSKTVTMTIECKTVFDNKDKLDSNLEKYIPRMAIF